MAFDPLLYVTEPPVKAGFDPVAYASGSSASVESSQVRTQLYPGEDEFFKQNKTVTGMAAEDGKVILNPYSTLSDTEKASVIKNETLRLQMRKSGKTPAIIITPEQRKAFSGTAYGSDDNALKQTIVARILSGDPSALATPEQVKVAQQFKQSLTPFDPKAYAGEQPLLDLSTLPSQPPAPPPQTASEALQSPDKRGIGEQLLSAFLGPLTPASRGVEALQALGAGGNEQETRGARAINALLGREEVPAADVVTNLTGIDRASLPDALIQAKADELQPNTGITFLDDILKKSYQGSAKAAGLGQSVLLEALLDPTTYIGIPGAKALQKGVPGAARGSTDDLLKGLVGGLGEGADVSPGAVIGSLDDGLGGAPRAAQEILSPAAPLTQRVFNLQEVTKGLQKTPRPIAPKADLEGADDMIRALGLPPDAKVPSIPMEGPKPTQLEQILQLEAPKSLPGAQQVGVGTTEGMGILPERVDYSVPDEVSSILSNPQKAPSDFLTKAPEEKSWIDSVVKNDIQRAMFEDAEETGKFLKRNPGTTEKILNFFRRNLGDKGKEFAREEGGGQVYQDILQAHKQESEALDHVKEVTAQAFGKYEKLDKFKKREIFKSIKYALESGDTSKLRNPLEIELFDAYTKRQAIVTKAMQDAGLPTITDKGYIKHQIETAKVDPETLFNNQLPGEVASSSVKRRTNAKTDFLEDDLVRLTEIHDKNIFHKIAYDPVLQRFSERAKEGASPKLIQLVRTSVFPERDPGGFFGWLTGVRFKTKLKYNPFSATENFTQRHLARGQVTGEANLLAKELVKHEKELNLGEIFEGGVTSRANDMTATEGLTKGGLFPVAERGNWRASRASGLAEEVVRHPEYQKLIKEGKSRIEAFQATRDLPAWSNADRNFVPQTVFERGKIRGEDLAASTQFVNAEGMRPRLFEAGSQFGPLKPFLQFKRFDASSFEAIKDMFTLSGKESRILRRGFSDETTVVDALNARRLLRDGLKSNVKQGKVTKEAASELTPLLDQEIKRLEGVVREIEPATKFDAAKHLGAFVGKSAAVRGSRVAARMGVFEFLKESGILGEDAKGPDPTQSLKSAAYQMIPGQSTAEMLKTLAGFPETNYGSNLTSEAISAIPGVGYVEGSVPGRPLSTIFKNRVEKPAKKKLKSFFKEPGKKRPKRPTRPERPTR